MRWLALSITALLAGPGFAQTNLLDRVAAAHGVTAATQSIRLRFVGRYEPAGGASIPFVLKTRGYGESRLELQDPSQVRIFVQSGGFRWKRAGRNTVRDEDGRVSINLPFMDSPSTGLLPFLLARQHDVETVKRSDGVLNGRAVIVLRLRIPDTDSRRRQVGAVFDRTLDLLIDPDTHRLTAAAVLRGPARFGESETYEYEDYVESEDLIFPTTVTRRAKLHPDSIPLRPLSRLRIDRVSIDANVSDDDFRKP